MRARLAGLGLRPRLMLLGVAGVAGALLVGGLLLYAVMTATLNRAIGEEARASAHDVAALVDQGRLPDPVPVSGAQVVQVLDSDNRVVSGSATADRLTAIVAPGERSHLTRDRTITIPASRAALEGDLTVAGVEAGPAGARVLVVAAVPTADVEVSRALLRRLLLVFFPLFLALMAFIAWRVIGSTLRPVEALRHGAERIGDDVGAAERLPVPPTHDEISALATTLNGMLDRLDSAQRRQRTFTADAAHELRSPLASMHTQLEVAQRLGEAGSLPADLLPEVQRLTRLVEDLLLLARSGEQEAPPSRQKVDLQGLVGQVAGRYATARVPVEVANRAGPVHVTAAQADLERALANLVDNAVRHAATCVTMAVSTGPAGPEMSVSDDGHGVPESDRERVFDRFARLDEARARDTGGSGLGLAITREMLRRHGADVRLEDAHPGLRAVVFFT